MFSVPPERVSIRDESETERASVVGPYSEGDIVKLKCDVYGGKIYFKIYINLIIFSSYEYIYRFNRAEYFVYTTNIYVVTQL